ncbi:hypothetical protein MHYP_G00273690 [Metynnis hypsauchen]
MAQEGKTERENKHVSEEVRTSRSGMVTACVSSPCGSFMMQAWERHRAGLTVHTHEPGQPGLERASQSSADRIGGGSSLHIWPLRRRGPARRQAGTQETTTLLSSGVKCCACVGSGATERPRGTPSRVKALPANLIRQSGITTERP